MIYYKFCCAGPPAHHSRHDTRAVGQRAAGYLQQGAHRPHGQLVHLQPGGHLRLRDCEEDERFARVQTKCALVKIWKQAVVMLLGREAIAAVGDFNARGFGWIVLDRDCGSHGLRGCDCCSDSGSGCRGLRGAAKLWQTYAWEALAAVVFEAMVAVALEAGAAKQRQTCRERLWLLCR